MSILVTGANGQLGREAVLALRALNKDVTGIDIDELDFSDPGAVADGVAGYGADWVINCAAYTQVDKAEEERGLAFAINCDSAGAVAKGVRLSGGRLLHISTDFVFGGDQSYPYAEEDPCNPINVYGQSKWQGEQAILKELPDAGILRTAWVYGAHGHNFVKSMLRLAGDLDELTVVDDQLGTPTWTADLFTAIWALIESDASGIFHFTNEGVASWYDFASEIIDQAGRLGFPIKARCVSPISTDAYPTAAQRPSYSVLSKAKIRSALSYRIPHWRDSLGDMLAELKQDLAGGQQ